MYSTQAVLRDFQNDGVVYLELRTTPRACSDLSKDEYVSTILECIAEFDQKSISTYLILSVDRKNSAAEAMEVVDLAIRNKDRGVVGIDLCGNPLEGDVSIYQDAFAKAKQHGLKLTLHFAEASASSTEQELQTLLSYNPNRLGHVINVPDAVKQEIIKRKLGLELCLSCNVSAKLISGGFANHHFSYWRDKGCPIILGVSDLGFYVLSPDRVMQTDDLGIFCSSLSNEYQLLADHFRLGRKALIALCKGAVSAIFGGEKDKERLHLLIETFRKENKLNV